MGQERVVNLLQFVILNDVLNVIADPITIRAKHHKAGIQSNNI